MSRSRVPDAYRQFLLRENRIANQLRQRKRRLYNRFYRKSLLFVSSWATRLLYFLLFVIIMIFYKTPGSSRYEELIEINVDTYQSVTTGRVKTKALYMTTPYGTYTSKSEDVDIRTLKVGDTIRVERNIFGKPIHYKKYEWNYTYGIYINYMLYYMILFLTFISFFFNDGFDPFTTKLLYVFYVINILSIALFFIT